MAAESTSITFAIGLLVGFPARIWRSRIHFLSTAPSKATTILFSINTTGFNLGERRSSRVSAATQKGEGLVPRVAPLAATNKSLA